jgi:hypothetical protein
MPRIGKGQLEELQHKKDKAKHSFLAGEIFAILKK